jgi:SAM-dependent methyltransferase
LVQLLWSGLTQQQIGRAMPVTDAITFAGLPSAETVHRWAQPAEPNLLAAALASLDIENHHEWAWANYKRAVRDLCKKFAARRLIEIGGGRDPLFDPTEIEQLHVEMTVNDIAAGELAVLPPGYRTACFDVSGDISTVAPLRNSFDLAFSRMVFEHVPDGRQAWSNLYELLAPGGTALAFIPTLYSLPYVLNWLLPDKVAAAIVKQVYHHRTDEADPIFPARYSWCFADDARIRTMLSAVGYREIVVQPFYGHGYYRSFPVIRNVHEWFTGIARRRDWRLLAGFAYIAARK